MKEVTLVFPIDDTKGEILLAMKKERFGAGKYNGMGGKIEAGESVREAAVREAREEVGIDIMPEELVAAGEITFSFPDRQEWDHHCYVFLARKWSGNPIETEEMAPEMFQLNALPFDRMWVSDPVWLPLALEGKRVKATVELSADGSAVLNSEVQINQELLF